MKLMMTISSTPDNYDNDDDDEHLVASSHQLLDPWLGGLHDVLQKVPLNLDRDYNECNWDEFGDHDDNPDNHLG